MGLGDRSTNIFGQHGIVKQQVGKTVVYIEEGTNKEGTSTFNDYKRGVFRFNDNTEEKNKLLHTIVIDRNKDKAEIIAVNGDTVTLRYLDKGDILDNVPVNVLDNSNFDRIEEFFGLEERSKILEIERERTLDNVVYLLNRYHLCACIRPTGFGKTYMAKTLMSKPQYNRILYLYPTNEAKNLLKIENFKKEHPKKIIDVKTYNWLWGRKPEELAKRQYDFVIFDEMDRIGGDEEGKGAYKTYVATMALINSHPKTHFLGLTATDCRMDGIVVTKKVFKNHQCYPYTWADAFNDGILKSPYYFYCMYEAEVFLREAESKVRTNHTVRLDRDSIRKLANNSDAILSELDVNNLHKNIGRICNECLPSTDYMKFIVFYRTHQQIEKNRKKVENWFRKAFPHHEIVSTIVTSATDADMQTVDSLPTTPSSPKYKGRIDIVFNCEILCRGYHPETISGLIIDRKIISLAKYIQILGRVLSCSSDKKFIIFDILDNYHTDFKIDQYYDKKENINVPIPDIQPQRELTTYEEVLAAYPHGINWDKVRRQNEKARKAEKMALAKKEEYEMSTQDTEETTLFDAIPFKDKTDEPKTAVPAKKEFDMLEIIEQFQNTLDEEETLSITEKENIVDQTAFDNTFCSSEEMESVESIDVDNDYSNDDEADYGQATFFYNLETRNLIKNNIRVLNELADVSELFNKIESVYQEQECKNILEEIRNTHCVGSDELYKNYSEVDESTTLYAIINAICGNHRMPTSVVIKWMIARAVE